jgi:aminoglycoside phosphotransferase (APT) family kinase protein
MAVTAPARPTHQMPPPPGRRCTAPGCPAPAGATAGCASSGRLAPRAGFACCPATAGGRRRSHHGAPSRSYSPAARGGPPPGQHNFLRGGPLAVYDGETQEALAALTGHIDTELAADVWQAALKATWQGRPVWFHGDVQPGNLLAQGGRLSAVIDFGTCGVGDPACDTTIAWTFLTGESSRVFAERLPVDRATWARGRGWAIWKAMKILVGALADDPQDAAFTTRVIGKILADHLASA